MHKSNNNERSYIVRGTCLLALLSSLNAVTAQATALSADGVFDAASIYTGKGVHQNLPTIPRNIVEGHLNWSSTYFAGLGLSKTRNSLGQSFDSLAQTPLANFRQGYEVVLLQHHGLQNNAEVGGAYTLRTPDLKMGPLAGNFATGTGFSYALGTPSFEDGPKGDPERRYHLQFLALFELEWHRAGDERLSFVTRVHHRCGVYGLVAPRNVGSNFMTAGIRFKF